MLGRFTPFQQKLNGRMRALRFSLLSRSLCCLMSGGNCFKKHFPLLKADMPRNHTSVRLAEAHEGLHQLLSRGVKAMEPVKFHVKLMML